MSKSPTVRSDSMLNEMATAQRVTEAAHARAEQALRLVCANLPWLSVLVYSVTLHVDERVRVAAVTASGRVLVNPDVFANLPLRDAVFILAHELLHLALDTFSRKSGFDDHETVNRAHDYIINDILRTELRMSPPLNGLALVGASEKSLEQIIAWMNENKSTQPAGCWTEPGEGNARPASGGTLSQALRDAGVLPCQRSQDRDTSTDRQWNLDNVDVIPSELEQEMFPDSEQTEKETVTSDQRIEQIRRSAVTALSLKELSDVLGRQIQQGGSAGRNENRIEALRGFYHTPWQVAMQRWMDAVAPGQRTYGRPSRRGSDRSDCVLPGRSREGWTLHLVLDTSGSMTSELARVLGAIAEFSETAGVSEVHILQCDVEVTVDEWVPVEGLDSYRIAGFGGSDMSPAMQRLSDDPEVSAMVVITDGYIDFPHEVPFCCVLWVLTDNSNFDPPYGDVLRLYGHGV